MQTVAFYTGGLAVARVSVSRERFRSGDLPEVCVATGRPADGLVQVRFDSTPDWTWILLLFGVLPFLIASWFATERVEGQLPVVREIVRRYHGRRRQSWLTAAGAGVLLLIAALYRAPALAWAGFAVLAIAGGLGIRAYFSFVNGRPDRIGDRVQLVRVHPTFAEAVSRDGMSTP